MGVINLTPDSFYPASRQSLESLESQLNKMHDADIIDLGAESTRPGAKPVAAEIQIAQLIPAIAIVKTVHHGLISIDTSDPKVIRACIEAGADMINDVRSLSMPGSMAAVADSEVQLCLTHMQGNPETMQNNPKYPHGLINTIMFWYEDILKKCQQHGIASQRIILDPGFGFGKSLEDNWEILKQLQVMTANYQIAIGVSNKSMFKTINNCHDVNNREIPSAIAEAIATTKKVAIIRSHNTFNTCQAIETGRLLGE